MPILKAPTKPGPVALSTSMAHASAPQACPTFVPDDAIARLAEATGTEPSALARLTVSSGACDLWKGIMAYLTHSPVPPGHPPVALHVAECSRPKDDDAKPRNLGSLFISDSDAARLPIARGAQRACTPVFKVGTSSVDFVWPPPPHLTAEALIKKTLVARTATASENGKEEQQKKQQKEEAEKKGDSTADKDDQKPITAADMAGRSTVHLFYYSVGAPVGVRDKVALMYEMLLVSPRGPGFLRRFAVEILEWYQAIQNVPDQNRRFPLFRFKTEHSYNYWKFEGLKRARPVDSVILAGEQMQMILNDLTHFMADTTHKWYYTHGLPYRRSLLFFGPPGTGKTSTVRVIASKFGLNCCVLSVATKKFSNQDLCDALSSMPSNSLLLLEDVDALFNPDRSNKLDNELTFSGMLNALDGMVSVEGLITIMTTNHIERLERALIRGGRVDRRFRFDLPNAKELQILFKSFYPNSDQATAEKFARVVLDRPEGDEARAVSTLQQMFIEKQGVSAEDCVSEIDKFFKQHFPPERNSDEIENPKKKKKSNDTSKTEEKNDESAETVKENDDTTQCVEKSTESEEKCNGAPSSEKKNTETTAC